jgi:hypothetical protein
MRSLTLFALAAACAIPPPPFPGTYTIVGYAKPGTHKASPNVPRDFRGATLILREDGSVTMRWPNSEVGEGEYSVNTKEHTAVISSGGGGAFLARFSHDTLVTRVPGGGPAFYWVRTSQ